MAALMGTRADLSSFHAAWFFMAACGLVGGLALLAIRDRPTPRRGRHRLVGSRVSRPV
ncbi:hypothetical protein NKH18_14550 [Streptomyces sp. M10(2022)]